MATRKSIPVDLLSVYDVMYMFDRRVQQIYRWRKSRGFPAYNIPGTTKIAAVRYSLREVIAWAKKNKIEITRMPEVSKATGLVSWPATLQPKFEAFQKGINL